MRWQISSQVPYNSYDYFEKTLITDNGFREYDVRWLLGKEINPNGFVLLGQAYGTLLQEQYSEQNVVVGHDFRSYSQELCNALIVGLLSSGIHVNDVGLAISPMVYFAQHHFQCRGAAMVTASHNENGWTGLKLAKGLSSTLGPQDIEEFKALVKSGKFRTGAGRYSSFDGLFEFYLKDLLRDGALPKPVKVVLAAGNGTAGRFAPEALKRLGCEVIELDCDPDWNFPKHNPNPEDVKFLHSISKSTVDNGADLGIGIDGDGDRLGVVDDQGREVYSDKLGLLIARSLCPKYPGRPVVIDVKSTGLFYDDPVLRASKTEVITWKTGHSYIKAKVAESNAIAGFEKSGHWFMNEPVGRAYDDALASAVVLLRTVVERGARLSALVDAMPRTWQSPTIGAYCADDAKYGVVARITHEYEEAFRTGERIAGHRIKSIVTVNGVRFGLDDDSWGLVRASSNKPSLALVGEARSSEDELYDIMEDIDRRLARTGQVGEYDQRLPPRKVRAS